MNPLRCSRTGRTLIGPLQELKMERKDTNYQLITGQSSLIIFAGTAKFVNDFQPFMRLVE